MSHHDNTVKRGKQCDATGIYDFLRSRQLAGKGGGKRPVEAQSSQFFGILQRVAAAGND